MTDLLLILSTLALLFITYLIRILLAVRIPSSLRFKPVSLANPPDIMADLFAQTEAELDELGFESCGWASIQTTPPLPAFMPPLVRLYHHRSQPVVARVSPPHNLFAADRCQVVFISRSRNKTFLATANRQPELFPRPPETLSIMLNTRVDSLRDQFIAHVDEMARRGLDWHDRAAKLGAQTWSLHLTNRYEKLALQWIHDEGFTRPLADGGSVPSVRIALRFLWRFLSGREKNPPHELEPIPTRRAAYLFANWQQTLQMPPPLSAQLAIFLASSLAFVVLAGAFWSWDFSLLLLGVIIFHETGHWLAMRLLGYRNLQILMLPMVGGVTLGQESSSKASHRVLVSLMGPLPGILFGFVILGFYGFESGWITTLGFTLLVVNYLNLLPILPLDGGQLLKALIPARRFGLLILFEWLGAAALLLIGWLVDSYFLSCLALVPFLSGLALLKRKQVLDVLEAVTDDAATPSLKAQTASVIHAIDHTDKRYRPLEKKAREIYEILSLLQLKQAAPAVAGAFLALYIASFVLPPVAIAMAFPKVMDLVELLSSDFEATRQAAYDRAITLPMPQLVRELADSTRRQMEAYDGELSPPLLSPPATGVAIAAAEQRLATHLDADYRRFLETGNGFTQLGETPEETRYLLLPVEQVERFALVLSDLYSQLRVKNPTQDGPFLVHLHGETAEGEYTEETMEPAELGHMLLIGRRYQGEYLLLDPSPRTEGSAPILQLYEIPGGLGGRRFSDLRHYLAEQLSLYQMAASSLAQ